MALARVMQFTPETEAHRSDYVADFRLMSRALTECQRSDGSWSVSLAAPSNYGQAGSEGPEMTGTSLFVGGMAYGVRTGLLDSTTYMPVIRRGWEAMARAVHDDTGAVGWLQGTGSKPEDGGIITFNSVPDFEDFGYGCWLWGAAEVHALAVMLEADANAITDVTDTKKDDATWHDLTGRRITVPREGRMYIHGGRLTVYRKQ